MNWRNCPIIGVIGAAEIVPEQAEIARELGSLVARRGGILICGGLGGVMEAACQGAKESGGLTIGILPGMDVFDANEFVDVPIVTGISQARNLIIALTAQVLIAIGGSYGTLSEIAFGLKSGKPVIALGSWIIDAPLILAANPQEAVEKAWRCLETEKDDHPHE